MVSSPNRNLTLFRPRISPTKKKKNKKNPLHFPSSPAAEVAMGHMANYMLAEVCWKPLGKCGFLMWVLFLCAVGNTNEMAGAAETS